MDFGGPRRGPSSFLQRTFTITPALLCAALLSMAGCTKDDGDRLTGSSTPVEPQPEPSPTEAPDEAGVATIDVSLYVEDHAGMDRFDEPVRSGVPIPRSVAITDVASFRVVDGEDRVVPAQFEVTSRWGGRPDDASLPIKWVLVSFLADVDADATASYRLQSIEGDRSHAQYGAPLVASDDQERIVVDTGAARFTISKAKFNLVDRVELADGSVLSSAGGSGGVYLQMSDGTRYLASHGVREVTVEENGPVEAVIVARGKHSTAAGASKLDYTIRMRFWQGRSEALVSYTFTERDLTSIRSYTAVDEAGIEVPVSVGANATFVIGGADDRKTGALTSEAWQRQTGRLSGTMAAAFDPGNADTLSYTNGGAASGTGGKARGWIAQKGDAGSAIAAVKWYWQQYPKKLRAKSGLLGVELWPSEEADMRVYAASQKTHQVLFGFHGKGVAADVVGEQAARRLAHPLVARCNPSWYAKTRVWNRIGIADSSGYPDAHRAVVDEFYRNFFEEEYPATFVDRAYDNGGSGHAFSMWDFGDGREDEWSNLAYDTPRSLFLHWALTGDRALLDRALEAVTHLRDVDVEHSPKDTRFGIRPNRGVSQPWLGRTRYNPTQGPQSHDLGFEGATGYGFEHHKGQSFADHWFLTGDRLSKEVLAESYHYYEQWLVDAESDYHRRTGNTRVVSHMLLVLLGYYDAYGTDEARERIEYVVSYLNEWQRRTSPRDPNGWMWTGKDDDTTSEFQNGVTAEALILYETAFPDGIPVRQNLVDAARWSIDPANKLLVNGPYGKYFNAWINENYGIQHATVLDPMMGPMLGYAYGATGEAKFRDVATEVILNSIEQDTSTPYLKAFTQQTRLVPAYFYWLQADDAKQEP